MAIEIRRVPDRPTQVGPSPRNIVTFSGAMYEDSRDQLRNALPKTAASPSGVTSVRFDDRRQQGRPHTPVEYGGVLGKMVAAALLRRDGVELDPGVESILIRAFDVKANSRGGVIFEEGEFTIPRDTEVSIETKIDLGIKSEQPASKDTTEPHIYRYEPLSTLLPDQGRVAESWIANVRKEYDKFTSTGEINPTRVVSPKLAYEMREFGGRASDETRLDDIFPELTEHIDEMEARQFTRIYNATKRGKMKTVGDIRNASIADFKEIRDMGANHAVFLKVAFARFDEAPADTKAN